MATNDVTFAYNLPLKRIKLNTINTYYRDNLSAESLLYSRKDFGASGTRFFKDSVLTINFKTERAGPGIINRQEILRYIFPLLQQPAAQLPFLFRAKGQHLN